MIGVTQIECVAGTSTQVTLPLQTGFVEILNDSNYVLFLTLNTGTCTQLPGVAQLYPTPSQGGTINIAINPTQFGLYMSADQGPSNVVTVNQYLPGEISGNAYPFMLTRSIAVQNNLATSIVSATATNLASTLTVTCPATFGHQILYLKGFDLDIDQESTTHQYLMTITGLMTDTPNYQSALTLNYTYRSTTTGAINDRVRFDPFGIPAAGLILASGGNPKIVLSIPAVSGSTARASINLYCSSL